jgi:hypothetical protein
MGNVTSARAVAAPMEPVAEEEVPSNNLLVAGVAVAVLVAGIAGYVYLSKGK